ncbi:YheC/YheD family endospore coat-associated protein [Marinicrinis sediminis]|uniref:YheC/YheD family protein n=1 Tax=Marinicrinis sediminis TaxID=1652465 RepID=A0ABW5R9M4_9BACL
MRVHNQNRPRPLLGILTMSCKKRGFRGNHPNFRDIIRRGRRMGSSTYIITVDELDLSKSTVKAYKYVEQTNKWKKVIIPIPYVLYNRIPYRKHEELPRVKQLLRECLESEEVKLYNPSFFYKWTLMEWLNASKLTKKYVPSTTRYQEAADLRKMLSKHSRVYLKPEKGKAGKGIMRIHKTRHPKLQYELKIQDRTQSQSFKFDRIAEISEALSSYMKKKDYIIQQAVDLQKYRGRPFDLRVLAQKNDQGRWCITGIGARIAGEESITTHVPRGGSIGDPKKMLRKVFGLTKSKQMLTKVAKASLFIAKQIERSAGHPLGEMSMDLGIDKKEQIWFFEANAKPMKFDEPLIRKKSLDYLFQYSRYLKNQSEERWGQPYGYEYNRT